MSDDQPRGGASRGKRSHREGQAQGGGDPRARRPRRRARRGRPDGREGSRSHRVANSGSSLFGTIFLALALVGLGVATVFIFLPFLTPLVTALVITVVVYPLYNRVLEFVGENRRGIASGITCVAVILLVFGPAAWFGWALASGAGKAQRFVRAEITRVDKFVKERPNISSLFYDEAGEKHPWWRLLVIQVASSTEDASDDAVVEGAVSDGNTEESTETATAGLEPNSPVTPANVAKVTTWVTRQLGSLLAGVFGMIFKFVLMVFIMYYFLKYGVQILDSVKGAIPVDRAYQDRVIEKFRTVTKSIVRGTLATAVIQGGVAAIAFLFLGGEAIFWGAMVSLCALVPVVGTALVTVPLTISFVAQAAYGKALAMAVIALVVANLDSFVRPLLLEGGLKLHPVWILLAILGGVGCFGALGLVLGPMVVVLLRTILALLADAGRERSLQRAP